MGTCPTAGTSTEKRTPQTLSTSSTRITFFNLFINLGEITMPRKRQSCRNCAGDCCSYVSFVQSDTSSPLYFDIMIHSVQELHQQEFQEVKKRHIPCPAKSAYEYSIYEHRPRLCRSYFCFGRYWRSAPVMSSSNITLNIVSTHQRRLQEHLLRLRNQFPTNQRLLRRTA